MAVEPSTLDHNRRFSIWNVVPCNDSFIFCPLINPEVVSTKKLWSSEDKLLDKPKMIKLNSNKFFIMYLTKSIILHQIFGM